MAMETFVDPLPVPVAAAFFVEAGRSVRHGSDVAGVGLRWPVSLPMLRAAAALEVAVNGWSVPTPQRRQAVMQATLVPVLRWLPAVSAPAWFVEAGVGVSVHDGPYLVRPDDRISHWNFQDVLALGRRLGAGQEISLRWSHVSNAGLHEPNPGDNRLSLRWTAAW